MSSHAAKLSKSGKMVKGPKGTASQRAVNAGKIKGSATLTDKKVKK